MTRNEFRELKKLMQAEKELNAKIKALKEKALADAAEAGVDSVEWSDMGYKVVTVERSSVDAKELEKMFPLAFQTCSRKTVFTRLSIH